MMTQKKSDHRFHGLALSLNHLLALKAYASRFQLKNTKKISEIQTGHQTATTHGRGMDFAEVRRYQPGDDIRSMDWRVTARTGKPHTKLFQEDREQSVYLVVNLSNSMQFGTCITFKSIIAAQVAALLSWKAVFNKNRLGGLIYNDYQHYFLKANVGHRNIFPLLRKMIALNPLRQTADSILTNPFVATVTNYQTVFKSRSVCFIISDFLYFDEDEQHFYDQLSRNNQLHFIHIYDPLEAVAPKPNVYSISNGKDSLQFDSTSKIFQESYQQTFSLHIEKIKKFCSQHRIRFTSIKTDTDLIRELKGL